MDTDRAARAIDAFIDAAGATAGTDPVRMAWARVAQDCGELIVAGIDALLGLPDDTDIGGDVLDELRAALAHPAFTDVQRANYRAELDRISGSR